MDFHSFLSELLYIISSYQKGKIAIKKIWSIKYIDDLDKSLLVMKRLVDLIKSEIIIQNDFEFLFDYVEENRQKIFSDEVADKILAVIQCNRFVQCANKNNADSELLILAENIIDQCVYLLNSRERKYKNGISYLLMAIHNIPRAFFANKRYLVINVPPLSKEETIKIALEYTELYKK